MPRITAAGLAACLIFEWVCPAARAHAQAAEPFQVVPVDAPAPHRHAWAYAGMLGGAALVGSSFFFAHRADEAYDRYLVSTDPSAIDRLYDRAVHNDHLSQVSLLGGEALIATGLYLRFIRRPAAARLSLAVQPSRCAVSLRF
ncbi:MAG: hypothetical protein E6K81_12190 [Candidatus Eisenbacteria bacterium]|uniref:Uncharacterized protein n=1 Tax=Eiseniibacteriota bacterium TaxID=2212470 RepID=A0A538U4F9_UNCEI|nr:MAG: hypothetical protein E6K81_12190 [Candidatus Eisenbacteria bacterium]